MDEVILRWNIWGTNEVLHEMLKHSVLSFQKYLSDKRFRYILACEDSDFVLRSTELQFHQIVDLNAGPFNNKLSTYKKFGPRFRLSPYATEIFVDADVFCLSNPAHLLDFIDSQDYVGMIQSRKEGKSSRLGFGSWMESIDKRVPPCCIGLMGFKPGYDITQNFIQKMFQSFNMPDSRFNDQGAIVKCMEPEILNGKIKLMYEPAIRYYMPPDYDLDLNSPDTEMVHCIGKVKRFTFSRIKSLL